MEDVTTASIVGADKLRDFFNDAKNDGLEVDRKVADAMGHKKTATTEIYIQRFNGPQADYKLRRQ